MDETLSTEEVWRMVNEILAEFGLPAARVTKDRSVESEPVAEAGREKQRRGAVVARVRDVALHQAQVFQSRGDNPGCFEMHFAVLDAGGLLRQFGKVGPLGGGGYGGGGGRYQR